MYVHEHDHRQLSNIMSATIWFRQLLERAKKQTTTKDNSCSYSPSLHSPLSVSPGRAYIPLSSFGLCISRCVWETHTLTRTLLLVLVSLSVWDTHRQKERHIEKGDKSDRPPSVRHTTHSALFLGRSPFPFSLVVCWKERPGWGEKGGFGLSCCPVKHMCLSLPLLLSRHIEK